VNLSAVFRGIRFPVDVSGGVDRFRHRRGELQRVELEVDLVALERWLGPRLRGLLGEAAPQTALRLDDGVGVVCISAIPPAERSDDSRSPVLAFDVHWVADEGDLLLVVANARGAGLPATPTALALACVSAALEGVATRTGAIFRVPRIAAAVARTLLPEGGARVPASDEVRCAAIGAERGVWFLHAAREAVTAPPTERGLRARDLAERLRHADDALMAADAERARALYLDALERSPRHAEIALRIADIDARDSMRAEAALALVTEAEVTGGVAASGLVLGELRLRVGDIPGAIAAFERGAEAEKAPAIAAKAMELAARAVGDADAASRYLDLALANRPRSTPARWLRVRVRLTLGRLEDALADVEHLEALAEGNQAKCSVWMQAGRLWTAAGLTGHAGPLFERALRYAPDDVDAIAGLGAALVRSGGVARGAALLAQAMAAAPADGPTAAAVTLELARVFAERLDDLPAAVAHAAKVRNDAREAALARGLEGRWRAALGDIVGAGLAFARLRELASSGAIAAGDERAVADLLAEAAHLERTSRGDPAAAQRHLATALRLRPHDEPLKRQYRELGAIVAGTASKLVPSPLPLHAPTEFAAKVEDGPLEDQSSEAERAARVDELARLLQANPRDEAVVVEMARLLEGLDRGPELLALLSARLEDASHERRRGLLAEARAQLARAADRADAAGKSDEARLLRDALAIFQD
jgi:tetratricopeptide (TPR) repeat protein